jgi:hypothetical protein
MAPPPNPYENIRFEDFRRFAKDPSLSKYEKIGFPDAYRKGFEEAIFNDIVSKLTNLALEKRAVVDIGPGCSDLPKMLIEKCRDRGHRLALIDSAEMLAHLPDEPFIEKVAALFPQCPAFIQARQGRVDAVLCYSVLHYVIVDTSVFDFLDASLSLLAPGGQMLIGDIPNVSKRKRFFSSEAGVRFHREFMQTTDPPPAESNRNERDKIDDAMLFALLQRARAAGFDAYLVPQNPALPMANRREDILIVRP